MYNRYLEQSPEPIKTAPQQETHSNQPLPAPRANPAAPPHRQTGYPAQGTSAPSQGHSDLLGELTGGLGNMLGSVLKGFSLENFDTGDILLILIILFLFLEGDNLEIVITLGLMLLLGLGDD